MNIPDSVLAAGLSVLGGAVVFVMGQVFVKAILEPVHELKREIARVGYSLVYYANQMGDRVSLEAGNKARDAFRVHSCRLRELSTLVLCYDLWIDLLSLPPVRDVMLASKELIGHSNTSRKPDWQFHINREAEIRRLLRIRDVDEIIADEQNPPRL